LQANNIRVFVHGVIALFFPIYTYKINLKEDDSKLLIITWGQTGAVQLKEEAEQT
jgi:hypothetical protein